MAHFSGTPSHKAGILQRNTAHRKSERNCTKVPRIFIAPSSTHFRGSVANFGNLDSSVGDRGNNKLLHGSAGMGAADDARVDRTNDLSRLSQKLISQRDRGRNRPRNLPLSKAIPLTIEPPPMAVDGGKN
ncbi:hypothetical protein EVAR_15779_1 [Eumeta japonica]|uniref:Uncharacterized protein n=1 Tax=Eumeta variegata TaxID=151549 RepID=A0A4C1TZB9_EUMVA|nr:hypothetical protein EVAR_15779_1 [Eumeta japonica]